MNILGVVIARGGSKGLPRKNLLKLGNKSLVEIAIDSALNSKLLTRVLVSTDDAEIFDIAKKTKAHIPFLRPKKLSGDKSSVYEVLKHSTKWLKKNENWDADIIVLLQSTTPFRRPEHIDSAIRLIIKNKVSSVMTVVKPDYPPHWMLKKDKRDKLKKLIDSKKIFQRRQDTPIVFQPAGSVYAITKKLLSKKKVVLPQEDTLGLEISKEESINIDTLMQYELSKIFWNKRNGL